jgi:hypothetical protein
MPKFKVTLEKTEVLLPGLVEEASPIIRRVHQRLTGRIVDLAKRNAPRDAGRLREQIRADEAFFSGLLTMHGGVTSHADYSVYVEKGTRPHVIRPRFARDLAFPWHGRTAFFKEVHHPGSRPKPFMAEAAREAIVSDPEITPE